MELRTRKITIAGMGLLACDHFARDGRGVVIAG